MKPDKNHILFHIAQSREIGRHVSSLCDQMTVCTELSELRPARAGLRLRNLRRNL